VSGVSRSRRYVRFLAVTTLIVIVVLAVGFQPTRRLAGDAGLPAMLIGCGIGFVGAVLAGIVMVTSAPATPVDRLKTVFFAMAVRLITAVVLGIVALWLVEVASRPLLFWLATSYVVLLPVEVRLAVESQ
jgi:hypothetical protein